MKKFSLYLLLSLFVFSLSSTVSFAERKERKKKGLGAAAEKKAEAGPQIVPNIHMQLGCESCHLGKPRKGDKKVELLMPNSDITGLCKGCHEDVEHHKCDVIPSDAIKVSGFLPLGKNGVSKGKVVCSTCHFTHVELASNSLLRGFQTEAGAGGGEVMFNKRTDLCNACHGEEFTKQSPHTKENEKLCGFCHSSDPKKAKDVVKETVKRDIVELCDFCHGMAGSGHFLEVNPFADKSISKDFPATLPLIDGVITCVTCHNGHGGTGNLFLLRTDYINFAVKSNGINPHEKRVFCGSCHEKVPGIKFGNDIEMCNWCHGAEVHHPLNVGESPDSKIVKLSKSLPLMNGKVTCLSCHERKFECQTEKLKEKVADKNPNYLIGGPYEKKNGLCFNCHIKSELEKIDAHKMLDAKGNVIASQCKFCHSLPPEKLVEGSGNPSLTGNINFLCILCHADRDHPGTRLDGTSPRHLRKLANERQAVVDGRIKTIKIKSLREISNIRTDLLPLDKQGNITCNTCHQAHQAGVLKSEKNKASAGEPMWRIPKTDLCNTCHSF